MCTCWWSTRIWGCNGTGDRGIGKIMDTTRSPVPRPWSRFFTPLLDILFPPLCHGCKAFIPDAGDLHLCPDCRAASPLIVSPHCTVCGLPFLTEGGIDHCCGRCSE